MCVFNDLNESLKRSEMRLRSPLGHPLARLMDLLIGDNAGEVSQVNQFPFVWGRMFGQERRYSLSPGGNRCPVLPLPPEGTGVSIDAGQKFLEDVLMEDQAVPAAGLSEDK